MTAAADDGVLLAAHGLAVGFGRDLLAGVEWALQRGEAWFLLGPNGSGKSTLLATLLGSLRPRRGSVDCAPAVLDRTGLGWVPQEDVTASTLPLQVAEFVELGLCGLALRRAERRARVAAALASLRLAGSERRPVREASGGQRRRVIVARALARRPRLLVLDEPTAGLDAATAAALAADLERQRVEQGLCMLHATHDLPLARAFATHVARIEEGRLVLQRGERSERP